MFTNITFFVEKYGTYKFYLYISDIEYNLSVEFKYKDMVKLEETKEYVIYNIHSIGTIMINKDRIWHELNSYPTMKISEDKNTITYRMADNKTCIIDKSLGLSVKEVIVRYYLMKSIEVVGYKKK